MVKHHRYMTCREFRGPFPHAVAIRSKSPSESQNRAQKFLIKCREEEVKRRELKKFAREHELINMRYICEKRNERYGREGMLRRKANYLMDESRRNTDNRRQKLSEFLANDEKELFNEVHVETTDERYQKNREKLKKMKERREKERLEEVERKRDQQFKEYSEELRSILSRRHWDEVCLDRKEQLRIKAEKARLRKEEEKMYAELWNKDFMAKAAKEEQQAIEKAEKNRVLNDELRHNIALAAHKKVYDEEKIEEAKLWKQEVELRKEEDRLDLLHKQKLKQERKKMLDDMLEAKSQRLTKEQEAENALNAKILEMSMQEKKSDAKELMRQKLNRRNAHLKYMRHLEEQRQDEKRRERELERLIDEDVKAKQEKDLMKKRLLKEAQKTLLLDVIKGRKEQIERKTENSIVEREQMKKEREKATKEAEEQLRLEQEKIAKIKRINKLHEADILAQIKFSESKKEGEKLEKLREHEDEVRAEEKFQEKMKEILSKAACYQKTHPLRAQYRLNNGLGIVNSRK